MMRFSVIILALTGVFCTEATLMHEELFINQCFASDGENMRGLDGDEMFHSDFIKGEGVITLPQFAEPAEFPGQYEQSLRELIICKQNLAVAIEAYKNPSEAEAPPQSTIYPMDAVSLGSENTLICHVTGFYPPRLRVIWTKNNKNVTEGVSLSQYYPNNDLTFNQFSTLRFTPEEGDIYSCTVEHQALERPQTKTWEPESNEPSIGPSVFCGVGLALGMLGVATGTFFLVKGNNCN